MAREKARLKVETLTDKTTGVEVVLYYNPNNNKHEARFNSTSFSDIDANVVRKLINNAIREYSDLKWQPIIEISRLPYFTSWENHAGASLSIKRYYVALSPKNEWREVDWDVDDAQRFSRNSKFYLYHGGASLTPETTFPIHIQGSASDNAHDYLPYDEALWSGLEELVQGIHKIRERIQELASTEQGIATLMLQGGAQLLLPGANQSAMP